MGCGNPLFGDDGFGPAVIEELERRGELPETTAVVDVGTGIQDVLFDLLLSPVKPKRIIIVDAVCLPGRKAGELFELSGTAWGKGGGGLFHQFPSLPQLLEWGSLAEVEVRFLAVQAGEIPDHVRPGLTPAVREAVKRLCDGLLEAIRLEENGFSSGEGFGHQK